MSDGIYILLIIVCEVDQLNVFKKIVEIGIDLDVKFELKILLIVFCKDILKYYKIICMSKYNI